MIDLIVLAVVVSYAVSGYRQGLAVGALSLGGFLFGAVVSMTVVPPLADGLDPGLQRSFAVLVAVLIFAWLGQLVGAVVGGKLRERFTVRPAQVLDQALGALAGIIAVTLVMWFIANAVRVSPSSSMSRAVSSSRVLRTIDAVVPGQVAVLADDFRKAVAGSPLPRVFAGVAPEDIIPVPSPNEAVLTRQRLAVAQRSIVKITGEAEACGKGLEGSGSVVGRDRVVTNAHVVAGMRAPNVQVAGVGRQLPARVVQFDPRRDLAVLAVDGLDAPPLRLGRDLQRGEDAIVAGFPENGPFKPVAARVRQVIQPTGEDIYGRPGTQRDLYSLFAVVKEGNSGGPMLDVRGALVGVVFAKSLDDPFTGYALTMREARTTIEAGISATEAVSTGRCAMGG